MRILQPFILHISQPNCVRAAFSGIGAHTCGPLDACGACVTCRQRSRHHG